AGAAVKRTERTERTEKTDRSVQPTSPSSPSTPSSPSSHSARMHIETLAVHAGHAVDPATGAVNPPIYLTTTFGRDADGTLPHGFLYARSDNPTRRELERSLAALEGGAVALAFASGMAATAAVFQSLAPGDHVVAPTDAYYGTGKLLREVMA